MIVFVDPVTIEVNEASVAHSYTASVPNVPSAVIVTSVASPLQILSVEIVNAVGAVEAVVTVNVALATVPDTSAHGAGPVILA